MRYLVRARVKPGREQPLLQAIEGRTLGRGSVAGDEYLRNMQDARLCADGTARWVEVCYCPSPLQEERPYWEQYFELVKVQDAHDRRQCRDQNGSEPWACENCDCTERLERKLATLGTPFVKTLLTTCSWIVALGLALGAPPPSTEPLVPAVSPYIDAHTHFDEHDPAASVRAVIQAAPRENMVRTFLLIPPDAVNPSGGIDAAGILAAAKSYPGRIAVLGGGETLNSMIQESVRSGDSGSAIQARFRERAEELLRLGAVGFGEMAAEHFDGATPYQYAPPDHPLFLLLADIAAQHEVPIDLHMEAVPQAMPLPPELKSPPNPPQLHENISPFERLLAHNPRARIIWAHLGSDGTGYRTPELCRRLLQNHSNLYMEIKLDPKAPGKNFLMSAGKIKPEWLKLLEDFPDRFIIGSDQHYPQPPGPQRWEQVVLLFNQLPADLRKSIGTENAAHIYTAKPTH